MACNRAQARESESYQIAIGFNTASDWFRRWPTKFLDQSQTNAIVEYLEKKNIG